MVHPHGNTRFHSNTKDVVGNTKGYKEVKTEAVIMKALGLSKIEIIFSKISSTSKSVTLTTTNHITGVFIRSFTTILGVHLERFKIAFSEHIWTTTSWFKHVQKFERRKLIRSLFNDSKNSWLKHSPKGASLFHDIYTYLLILTTFAVHLVFCLDLWAKTKLL